MTLGAMPVVLILADAIVGWSKVNETPEDGVRK